MTKQGFFYLLLATLASLGAAIHAQVRLAIEPLSNTRIRINWPEEGVAYQLETTKALDQPWRDAGLNPQIVAGQRIIELSASDTVQFFRLRQGASALLTVQSSSPSQGESGVAVTREAIFRLNVALSTETTLTISNVYATAAGRKLLSRVELGGDRRTVTLFNLERLPADARVKVTFDGTGLFDGSNRPVDLDGDGVPGGAALLEFDTLSTTALSTTGIEGHVYASEKNPDGSNHPLRNVTITVDGMEETLRTTSDENGFFRLQPCPSGRFFVSVDGRTADGSQWPGGAYYPFVGKAWEATPGRTNNHAGPSGVVYLPQIQADALRPVSAATGTTITFAPSVLATNPALAGVEIFVPANALYSDNGTRGGRVGIAPVPPDRLPEPLPPGLNLPLVITIQTDGPSNFDQPVPVKFPNLPDPVTGVRQGPGEKTALWSFNHDTGRWEPQGMMTISPDGNFATTDPGVGVRQPGWHGAGPGSGGGGPGGPGPGPGPDCEDLNANGICDKDDDKRCEKDRLKTIFAGVDAFIGFVPQPDMGPLGSCLNGGAQSSSQAIRDCSIDPPGCKETVALKILDFSIDCGLSFVPASKGFREAVSWIKRIKGLFDAGLAYANWQLCKDTPPTGQSVFRRQSIVVGGFSTRGNPFLQQYEVETRLHRFIELAYGNARWAEIDPTEWPLSAAIVKGIRAATLTGSDGGKAVTVAERESILGLRRPTLIQPDEVEALIDRLEKLLARQIPDEGDLDTAGLEEAANGLSAILSEVVADGWNRVFDGWTRCAAIQASAAQSGSAAALAGAGSGSPVQLAATGGDDVMPARPLYYIIVDRQTGFERRGRLNSHGRFDGVILRPSAPHVVVYFDATTGRSGIAYFTSNPAGQTTIIPGAQLVRPPAIPDSDGDGLSDAAEVAVGTLADQTDTDGDGVPDGAEISNGTDPSDNQPLSIGVVASRATARSATDIDTVNDLAVLADANAGLAVFDVSNPLSPLLIGEFNAGTSSFEAVSAAGEYVAAVPGSSSTSAARVHLFRLQGDGTLAAAGNVAVGVVPKIVVAAGLYAYAPGQSANAPTVAVVRLSDALLMWHVPVSGGRPVLAMTIDGDVLWALTSSQLLSFRIVGDNLQPLGVLGLADLRNSPLESGPKLAVGNGRVYVGDFGGFRVVGGSNPATPTLLRTPPTTQAAIHDLALSGGGLLVPISSFSGTASLALSAYDIRGDQVTNFLASFDTPGSARAVALHRGYGLVADSSSGMAVVNFLATDRGTNPPTILLRPFFSHPPSGQEADQAFYISTTTTDDVQVRDVEFHIDGVLAGRSGKFPFATTLRAPPMIDGKTKFTLRAKATDTGGNSAWSDEIQVTLLPDLTPIRLLGVTPAAGSVLPRGSISELTATFDSAVNPATLQGALSLLSAGTDGLLGTADDLPTTGGQIGVDGPQRVGSLRFNAPLRSGKYRARLVASVADLAGNPLGTNVTWDFSIPTPRPVLAAPADRDVLLSGSPARFELRFDERLTPSTVTTASLRLITTNLNNPATLPGGIASLAADGRTAVLEFAQPLTNGAYRLVATPEIRDVFGSPVETNFPVTVSVKGPAIWTNNLSGFWQSGTNWAGGAPPLLNDHVVIDRPEANPTVTLGATTTVTSLRSEEDFVITSTQGALTVLDRAVFNGYFSLKQASFTAIIAKSIEFRGGALLTGALRISDEALFQGPLTVNEGDFSLTGGRSRFFGRIDDTRTTFLGSHTMTIESGAVAAFADNQIQFGGVNSRLVIAAGGRFELTPVITNRIAGNFFNGQGATGGAVENLGEFVKRGTTTSYSGIPMTNSGALTVEEGTLSWGADFENRGTINVSAAGILDLGRSLQHRAGRIAGAGQIRLPSKTVVDAPYEVTGLTEIYGQDTVKFNVPIHSTGSWLIKNGATFNGSPTELFGPVTIQGGDLVLNSPGETLIPNLIFEEWARLGGTGLLVIRKEQTLTVPLTLKDGLTTRFEAPWTIATNLTTTDQAHLELTKDTRWTGGALRADVRLAPGVALELAHTNTFQNVAGIPFPQEGIVRKTGAGAVFLSSLTGSILTNRTLIEILGGTLSTFQIFTQEAGELRLTNGTTFVADALRLMGGELNGSGTVAVRSDSSNRGCHLAATVSPGRPYGILNFTFQSSPIWMAGSRAVMDIGGTEPGVSHDQITCERTIRIDGGTLEIRTAPGFVPTLGQEFTLMTFTGRTGTFPEVVGLEIGNGRRYRVVYEAQAIKLRVEGM